jgi:hypothetical protein
VPFEVGRMAGLAVVQGTEEGQKVARNEGKTWRAVYRRIESPALPPAGQQAEQQQQGQQEG